MIKRFVAVLLTAFTVFSFSCVALAENEKTNEVNDMKEVVESILNAPSQERADSVVLKEGEQFLNEKGITEKTINQKTNASDSLDDNFDVYDEFDNMMKNF